MPAPLNNPNGRKIGPFKFNLWWMYAIVIAFLGGIYLLDNNEINKPVSYSDFIKYVEQDHGVSKIIIHSDNRSAEGILTDSLAQALFPGNYREGAGIVAKIETNITSADKLDEKIEQWRKDGDFTGDIEIEQSGMFSHLLWRRSRRRHFQCRQIEGHAFRQRQCSESDIPRRCRPLRS